MTEDQELKLKLLELCRGNAYEAREAYGWLTSGDSRPGVNAGTETPSATQPETIKSEQPNPLLRLGDGEVSARSALSDEVPQDVAGRPTGGDRDEQRERDYLANFYRIGFNAFNGGEPRISGYLTPGLNAAWLDGWDDAASEASLNLGPNAHGIGPDTDGGPNPLYRPPETPETEADGCNMQKVHIVTDAQSAADNSSGEEIRIGMTESGVLIADGKVIEAEPPPILRSDVPTDALISVHADGETYATFGGTTYHVTSNPEPDTGPVLGAEHEDHPDQDDAKPPSGLQSPEDETGELQLEQLKGNEPEPIASESQSLTSSDLDLDPSPASPEPEPRTGGLASFLGFGKKAMAGADQ